MDELNELRVSARNRLLGCIVGIIAGVVSNVIAARMLMDVIAPTLDSAA